jgi:hypothetical protein
MIKLPFTSVGIILMLLLVAIIFIGGPLALIWAVNTLFPTLAIPYTLETWLAAFIIPAAFKANITTKKD